MTELTTRERFSRIYAHQEADRVPIFEVPWETTLERWHSEGLPEGMDWEDYFGADRVYTIIADNSPRYPVGTVEETDEYTVRTTEWGVTLKKWRHMSSTPQYMDFTIVDRASWEKAKARMIPTRDRIPWYQLELEYRKRRERGDWIEGL